MRLCTQKMKEKRADLSAHVPSRNKILSEVEKKNKKRGKPKLS